MSFGEKSNAQYLAYHGVAFEDEASIMFAYPATNIGSFDNFLRTIQGSSFEVLKMDTDSKGFRKLMTVLRLHAKIFSKEVAINVHLIYK